MTTRRLTLFRHGIVLSHDCMVSYPPSDLNTPQTGFWLCLRWPSFRFGATFILSTDLNPIPIHLVLSRFSFLLYRLSLERPSVGRLSNTWEENAFVDFPTCTALLVTRYSLVEYSVLVGPTFRLVTATCVSSNCKISKSPWTQTYEWTGTLYHRPHKW